MNSMGSFSHKERQLVAEKARQAKQALSLNVRKFEHFPVPLLIAGDNYPGIWLEHNQDNIYLAEYLPEAAWASQQVFMDYQREDGLLPFMFLLQPDAAEKSPACYWHLQSVYPFAACALKIALRLGKDDETLAQIYAAGAKYDSWLVKNRNKSGTGLVEMYCEWDTGHDNAPRAIDGGIPHTCPGKDAKNMPDLPMMPILSADLSAMLHGGRLALAELARRLGKGAEEARWLERAAELRGRIRELLYDEEDDFYYDRGKLGFRKYRTEHITRLFLNQVLEQEEFDRVFDRYFTSDQEFWPAYPIPAVSVSDEHFVKACPRNCWGANAQALTALRALMWLESYGRTKERMDLMERWLRAYLRHDNPFAQELNPFTGAPVGPGRGYTPAAIMFLQSARAFGIA